MGRVRVRDITVVGPALHGGYSGAKVPSQVVRC